MSLKLKVTHLCVNINPEVKVSLRNFITALHKRKTYKRTTNEYLTNLLVKKSKKCHNLV